MILADYHTHCLPWSPDAECSMTELCRGAAEAGMTHLCITNHIENCCQTPQYPDQFPPMGDWDGLYREFAQVREAMAGVMDVRLGAEVGSPHYLPEEGRAIYGQPIFDFVIGSVHNLRGKRDFYFLTYPEDFQEFRPEIEEYLDEYIQLAGSGLCDVLGHIGYMQRYMARQGKGFDMMDFQDRLRTLFKLCVERGVGLEVNCSGLRDVLGDFIPQPSVLRLYRELGGEIVTTGTDAHSADRAGAGIRESRELLRSLGFQYFCLYKDHRPEFIRLNP